MSDKLGLVGRKVGMTRIFTEEGVSVPVTVLDVSNNRVTAVKTEATDGYNAIQVAFGTRRPSRVTKALAGQFAKAGVEAGSSLKEFHVDADKVAEFKAGQTLSVEIFTVGEKVDVTAHTIGKASPASSSVTTSSPVALRTVTRLRRTLPVLPVIVRTRAACSPASVWLVISAMCSAPPRIWLWPALMPPVACFSSAAQCLVPRMARSLFVPLSRLKERPNGTECY